METHRLVQEGGARDAEWVLSWDTIAITLDDPDGQRRLEAPLATVHRLVELFDLYSQGKVSFDTPDGFLTFKKQAAATAAVRALVEAGLARDPEFCFEARRKSLRSIFLGPVMFVAAGGLFGLYCWWAFTAGDPPPEHWIRWLGWLIHLVLIVLLAAALAGPLVAYSGLRQWLRIRRIERRAAETQRRAGSA